MTYKTIGLGLIACFLLSGCSVMMALKGEDPKDYGAIRVGMPRSEVLNKLSAPDASEETDSGKMDIYYFDQGNERSVRRAVYYGLVDVVTIGIYEVIGTPAELLRGKKELTLMVEYNENDELSFFQTVEGKHAKRLDLVSELDKVGVDMKPVVSPEITP